MIKFVKVRFPSSTKEYDYICDLEDVKKGDYVYVDTRHGTKTVRVGWPSIRQYENITDIG